MTHPSDPTGGAGERTVLVYSDDVTTRDAVRLALGTRPAADLPALRYVDCATPAAVVSMLDAGGVDLVILDGEAVPAGGYGVCRQLKQEIFNCPPVVVLAAREQDHWLAMWSLADAAVSTPLDPMVLARTVSEQLRSGLPGRV